MRTFGGYLKAFLFSLLFCSLSVSHAFQMPDETTPENSYPLQSNLERLHIALATYENGVTHPWPIIPENARLKRGVKNHYVVLLRDRLERTNDLLPQNDNGSKLFDRDVEAAVKLFQSRNGLTSDGVVGKNTRAELNVPAEVRMKQLLINIDRWEKLAPLLGNRYALVNIPDFRLDVIENGQTVLTMKAVVGKPDLQTPEIHSIIKRLVFNPYWNIPKKIANHEIIPKMQEDPNYLSDNQIEVLNEQSDNAHRLNAHRINWDTAQNKDYFFRQIPGEHNALGLVKFEFENEHDVYLHDTPAKSLFETDERDLSHGCVRLEKPFELVDYLMKDNPDWDEDETQSILEAGKTRYIRVPEPLPIFITYITAWVDENGIVQFRDDIYEKDTETTNDQ